MAGAQTGPGRKRTPKNNAARPQPLPEAKREEVAKKAGAARLRAGKRTAAGRGRPG